MILEKVTLENWQGYYGPDHEFRFDGVGGMSSSIIYADNTVGKTAFWESIEFCLFGRVQRKDGSEKPLVAKESGDRPLLNTDAFKEGKFTFMVEIRFRHDSRNYRLMRLYQPGRKVVRHSDDVKEKLELEDISASRGEDRFKKDADAWIRDNILPERLKKFFLFDGQRLEKYEELMEPEASRQDHTLQSDIEDIIRLPVLKNGKRLFSWYRSHVSGKLGVEKAKFAKGEKEKKRLEKLNKEIMQKETDLEKDEGKIKEYSEQIEELEEWLRNNEKTKIAAAKIDEIEELIRGDEKAIEGYRKDIKNEINDAWRRILKSKVDNALKNLESDIKLQKKNEEAITLKRWDIDHINAKLEGRKCRECGTKLEQPKKSEIGKLKNKIDDLTLSIKDLEKKAKYPSHETVVKFREGLRPMETRGDDLSILFSKEIELEDSKRSLIDLNNKLNQAKKGIEESDEDEARINSRKMKRSIALQASLAKQIEVDKEFIKALRQERDESKISIPDGHVSLNLRILEKSEELAKSLCNAFEETLEIYREKSRKRTEEIASEIFLGISNNSKNYEKLRINQDFSVDIISKRDGHRDAGSQAQSIVMAYAVLDALGRCSDYEFPMVIDTPGRGMASKNLGGVWKHLTSSRRQVIALPYDKELAPEEGDKISGNLAATYELEKIEGDRTIIKPRKTENLKEV